MVQQELLIPSTLDGSLQPSLFYRASAPNRPLLVGLHTWSYDRFNQIKNMLPFCREHDFNLLLPEFRGPNTPQNPHHTEACGSLLARTDIKDAIDHVVKNEGVDAKNVFLLGLSGGGHMALLMCGFCPTYFKAVGAFVPITDLEKWTEENPGYKKHVLACCGDSAAEMLARSPICYVDDIARANVKIFHGKFDPVVPVSQSETLYRTLREKHPTARVFLDIFDGGHELDMAAAAHWILTQYHKKQHVEVTG